MKKLLVIDGNSILNRAFFGIRALTDKNGRFTNAIFGLANVLHRELTSLCPDYAAIAFDVHAPTFRKELYAEYKANRHGMPEELHAQLDDAKYCAERMGFCRMELPGYEADDILGTLSAMTEADPELHVYVLSGDRDLLQLISPRVSVLLAGNTETALFDRDAFFAKYGVEPEQFVDVKALMGDSSDNIPGVPGVGEKTAFRLIATHGSLDNVYEHLDAPDITKGLRAKLEAGRELAYLSKKLVTILRDAPIGKTLADLAYHGMDRAALYEKFVELEFSGLIRKFGLDAPVADEASRSDCPCESVDYPEADAACLLAAEGEVAVTADKDAFYFSIGGKSFRFAGDVSTLAPLFDGNRKIITYDAKSLYHTLASYGVTLSGTPDDVMLYAYAVDAAGGTPALSSLFTAYLSATPAEGEPCAHLLPALRDALAARVEENGATALLHEIELPLAMLLARMEAFGFKLDRAGLESFRGQLEVAMNKLIERIYYLAGEKFNINSPKQLGVILFEKLGLPAEKKTKTGYSTDVETLNHLRRIHPIVGEILDYRQISKLYATYAVGLLHAADEKDRIHTDFKQALTATGRLSSAEPNLQNIPIRTELGREMRRFFVPENEDYLLVDADYSQIELRLLAHMAGDERMIAAFCADENIHTATASAVFGVPKEEVTAELRRQAKAVNFGIVYGIGPFSLAGDLGISTAAAKEYIESYFATYPGIAAYLDAVVEAAYEKGYSTTLYGRRRSIPELRVQNKVTRKFGERVAMNSPIQGTAADIMKIAMLRVDRRLAAEGLDARLIMQVHDELIVEAHKSVADRVAAILAEEMGKAADLSVPLTVDVAVMKTWLE